MADEEDIEIPWQIFVGKSLKNPDVDPIQLVTNDQLRRGIYLMDKASWRVFLHAIQQRLE